MLSRFLCKPSNLRFITLISSQSQSRISPYNHHHFPPAIQNPSSSSTFFPIASRFFSSNGSNGGGKSPDIWNFSSESEGNIESFFGEDAGSPAMKPDEGEGKSWLSSKSVERGGGGGGGGGVEEEHDIFRVVDCEIKDFGASGGIGDGEVAGEESKGWNFMAGDEKDGEGVDDFFAVEDGELPELVGFGGEERVESRVTEEEKALELEEKALSEVLKGKNRAFGDLIDASGITDEMLDSLIALKDLDGVPGLPPLSEIERMRYEKNTRKSTRADFERQKQEEITKQQVRRVDSNGRAYGTGKRKCSIARVWIEPGDGKFLVNGKQFDAYFPILDHRAALLRPFTETKTLGLMDVNCTVKGGGVSGQAGAIRLGISRALQNWAPEQFRPPLKAAGFLTRDSRIVERKKPGKAKARKSFQWVKR